MLTSIRPARHAELVSASVNSMIIKTLKQVQGDGTGLNKSVIGSVSEAILCYRDYFVVPPRNDERNAN